MDWQPRDALVAAGDSKRLVLDLFADLAKVVVPPVGVQELSILVRDCVAAAAREGELRVCGRRGSGRRRRRRTEGRRGVDELEDERSAGDDPLASREKVSADNPVRVVVSLKSPSVVAERERGRLTSRGPRTFRRSGIRCKSFKRSVSADPSLGSTRSLHDDDLRQVDRLAANGRERVLELVERPDQVDSAVSLGRHAAVRSASSRGWRGSSTRRSRVGERLKLWAGRGRTGAAEGGRARKSRQRV